MRHFFPVFAVLGGVLAVAGQAYALGAPLGRGEVELVRDADARLRAALADFRSLKAEAFLEKYQG